MSLHNLFGDTGGGKSAYLMDVVTEAYFIYGQKIYERSCAIIDKVNKEQKTKLSYPKKVPIYINFKVGIENPDGSKYEPYLIKGKEIGIGDKYRKIHPGAVIVIDEAQNEFNSKNDLPRAVSAFFEKHRHADYDIWIASQRPILINKDIRDLSRHFIHIYRLDMTVAPFGVVCGLKWYCREFDNRADVDEYVEQIKHNKGDNISYKETIRQCRGDVLNYYDSKSCLKEFMPKNGSNYED